MPKARVYELAKDLGVDTKEILNYLAGLGADVRNHMSFVDDRYAELARRRFAPAAPAQAVNVQAVQPRPVGMPPRQRRGPGAARPASPQASVTDKPAESVASVAATTPTPVVSETPTPVAKPEPTVAQSPVESKELQQAVRPEAPGKVETPAKSEASVKPVSPGQPRTQSPAAKREAPRQPRPAQGRPSENKPNNTKPADGRPSGGRPQNRPAPANTRVPETTGTSDESDEQPRRQNRTGGRKPGTQPGRGQAPGAGGVNRPGATRPGPGRPGTGRPGTGRPGTGRPGATGRPGGAARPAAKRSPRRPAVAKAEPLAPEQQEPKILAIPDTISVADLAEQLNVPATTVIKTLMTEGVMAAINNVIDFDVASMVAEKLGAIVERPKQEKDQLVNTSVDTEAQLLSRPPVVTILGHVDHGKTTLLDAIREARVVESEAGGITQHIGAYQVEKNNRLITFLDTPGHEAFTEMRSRGAQVTDIAVLVVAADDGVMPQTIEALNHAKAAEVPIITAINKIDRPGANPDRVKQQLADHGLLAEDWGGDTVMVEVSALKKLGIEELLEMVLLVADMRDLRANPDRQGSGTVVEAELDKNRGPIATVLVQNGTLHTGDAIVAGSVSGRVRAMFDYRGKSVKEAGPSTPVAILGLEEVPEAGDLVEAMEDDRAARTLAEQRAGQKKAEAQKTGRLRLSELFAKIQEGEVKDLNLIVKADVQGSVEALSASLEKMSDEKVRVNVIHGGAGAISEADVSLAAASNAVIIGFNVRPDPATRRAAEREGVDIRLYRIIYEAIDDVKAAMTGLLDPTFEEAVLGRAEVRATFRVPNVGTIAGSYVTDGKILRNASVRVLRDSVVIFEGKISSLKRFKEDAREVAEGYECGIGIERFNDVKESDIIEAFQMREVKA